MTGGRARDPHAVGLLPLWLGLVVPPLAWTLHLLVGYWLDALACHAGAANVALLLHLLTLATLALTAAAGVVAYLAWDRSDVGGRLDARAPAGRSGFLALFGVLMSGLFFLVILAGAVPDLMLGPC
jgi:hypothetical protein